MFITYLEALKIAVDSSHSGHKHFEPLPSAVSLSRSHAVSGLADTFRPNVFTAAIHFHPTHK